MDQIHLSALVDQIQLSLGHISNSQPARQRAPRYHYTHAGCRAAQFAWLESASGVLGAVRCGLDGPQLVTGWTVNEPGLRLRVRRQGAATRAGEQGQKRTMLYRVVNAKSALEGTHPLPCAQAVPAALHSAAAMSSRTHVPWRVCSEAASTPDVVRRVGGEVAFDGRGPGRPCLATGITDDLPVRTPPGAGQPGTRTI
jgi:hypothetical protein